MKLDVVSPPEEVAVHWLGSAGLGPSWVVALLVLPSKVLGSAGRLHCPPHAAPCGLLCPASHRRPHPHASLSLKPIARHRMLGCQVASPLLRIAGRRSWSASSLTTVGQLACPRLG